MEDLKLDIAGDLALTSTGDLATVDGLDAVTQRLRFALQHFKGEWTLDEAFGVPWFQDVLKKNPNPVVIDAVLKQVILATPGVLALESLDLDWDRARRRLTVRFSALTTSGRVKGLEVSA